MSLRVEDTPGHRIEVRAGCAPRPIPATSFATSTTRLAMLKGTTDTSALPQHKKQYWRNWVLARS
eukprot:1632444-Pyramimonas_sp.AAC.1